MRGRGCWILTKPGNQAGLVHSFGGLGYNEDRTYAREKNHRRHGDDKQPIERLDLHSVKSYGEIPEADCGLGAEHGIDRAAAAASLASRDPIPEWAPQELGRLSRSDPDPRVRSAALGALARPSSQELDPEGSRAALEQALRDLDPGVRRRACEEAPRFQSPASAGLVVALLDDPDSGVVEAAAWALGELGDIALQDKDRGATTKLAQVARTHPDPLAREAAVAALGALGDEAGLPAILDACQDKPAIRRRAVLALASFDNAEVDAALARAVKDTDWQVRQAAEDLLERP